MVILGWLEGILLLALVEWKSAQEDSVAVLFVITPRMVMMLK